ncbi:DNA repair protein RAD51 [Exophiala viscosa]|uniref:DNA repair protein RAD51 n=1 Tax=Exophiala viscosa TaxID=2486360 RepID=A0AAN6E1R1_9EURO|nr:DNA repair protein RAD51 [Exophiala viscosa]
MATSGGHLLVPKAMRLIRYVGRLIREKIPQAAKPGIEANAEPAYARITQRQPVNRLDQIRQAQSRYYSTSHTVKNTVRHYSSQPGSTARRPRASYPSSRSATAVGRSTGRAPFAATLRPNLTGGALCRSAGGYGLGGGRVGGARYFSHSPAAPAQVVNNVSQAVRAFWLSGQKARFDGANPRTGEKRYRAISSLQEDARHTMDMSRADAPGSFIDFKVCPTITAVGPLSTVPRSESASTCDYEMEKDTLNNTIIMSNLSADFGRALKDLAAIMNDLKRLATLGDLPITLHNSTTLRVRFSGCDADTVENLCRELNIKRGIVGQDEDFDAQNGTDMALMFPYAPSRTASEVCVETANKRPAKRIKQDRVEWHEMLTPPQQRSPGFSHVSATSQSQDAFEMIDNAMGHNPWVSSPSGYSSLHESEVWGDDDAAMYFFQADQPRMAKQHAKSVRGDEYEGLEGIYRFIEQCDRARS